MKNLKSFQIVVCFTIATFLILFFGLSDALSVLIVVSNCLLLPFFLSYRFSGEDRFIASIVKSWLAVFTGLFIAIIIISWLVGHSIIDIWLLLVIGIIGPICLVPAVLGGVVGRYIPPNIKPLRVSGKTLVLEDIIITLTLLFIIWTIIVSITLPVFLEYISERIGSESAQVVRCMTVENGTTVYEIDAYINNVMSDHTYFSTNGSFICSESTHADRTVITEGTSCPKITTCW